MNQAHQAPLFEAPEPLDIRQVSPTGAPISPVSGSTPATRFASYSGAVHADETRTAKIVTLRQVWREALTINEVAAITSFPVSSVCSLRKAIKDELEEVDHERIDWGPGRKATWRTRWRLRSPPSCDTLHPAGWSAAAARKS